MSAHAVEGASAAEIDAILISRLIRSEDRAFIGANLPAPRCGTILAALTHAAGARVAQGMAWIDVESPEFSPGSTAGMDVSTTPAAEAYIHDYEAFDDVGGLATFVVIGGFEIDPYGNTNLLGVHQDGRWIRRGAGPLATTGLASIAQRTILYATRHDQQVFVEACSVISALGWGREGCREQLGLPTPGPEFCISPAGVFDFPAGSRRMRLVHFREGWTPKSVQEATGFPLEGLETSTPLPEPPAAELADLRRLGDPAGALR
jgi:acyl CoA:acetate/3-ketoacid CoA transferase beta subunit